MLTSWPFMMSLNVRLKNNRFCKFNKYFHIFRKRHNKISRKHQMLEGLPNDIRTNLGNDYESIEFDACIANDGMLSSRIFGKPRKHREEKC